MTVKFTVLGEPQGKGRPRTSIVKAKGKKPRIINRTPENTVIYENFVKTEYERQVGAVRFPDDEPLDMRIIAFYRIPASASNKDKRQMESGEIRPTKKPDMDNIAKAIADSLNDIAYRDDKQIVDCLIRKYYSHKPRVCVIISTAKKGKEQKL